MSLLGMIIAVWWLFVAVRGFRRGLVRTAISMVSFLLIAVLVSAISPAVSGFLTEKTTVKENVAAKCADTLEGFLTDQPNPERSEQIRMIEELPVPMLLKEELLENNNSVIYDLLSVSTFEEYLTEFLASAIVRILSYLIAFFLASLILRIVVHALDLFANLPILGGVNRIGGFMLGAVSGLLYLWIFFLIVTLFAGTQTGAYLMREIAGDKLLDYLYQNNLLMKFLMSALM